MARAEKRLVEETNEEITDEWKNGAIIEIVADSQEELDEKTQKVMGHLQEKGIRPSEMVTHTRTRDSKNVKSNQRAFRETPQIPIAFSQKDGPKGI